MAKKSSCGIGGKGRIKKRYILLLILLVVVVVAFRYCGNRNGAGAVGSVAIEGIDFAANESQVTVNLLLAEDSVPEAQWRTLSAGEETYTPSGMAADPLLGAYAVELVLDGASFAESLTSQYGFVTQSLQKLGFGGPAESFRLAQTEDGKAVFYLGYSKAAAVTVDQGVGSITLCLEIDD